MLRVELTYNRDPFALVVRQAEVMLGQGGTRRPAASHVRIVRRWGNQRLMHYQGCESTPRTGVHMYDPHTMHDDCRVYVIHCTSHQERVVWQFLERMRGHPYSWRAVLRAFWWGLTGQRDRFYGDPRGRFDCATLVLAALRSAEIDPCPGVGMNDVSPALLEEGMRRLCAAWADKHRAAQRTTG